MTTALFWVFHTILIMAEALQTFIQARETLKGLNKGSLRSIILSLMNKKTELEKINLMLELGLNTYTKRINKKLKADLLLLINREFDINRQLKNEDVQFIDHTAEINLALFLNARIRSNLKKITVLHKLYKTYLRDFSDSQNETDQQIQILNFSQKLGFTERQLAGDKKAFNRYFGHDAMIERYNKRLQALEKEIKYYLERTSEITVLLLLKYTEREALFHIWESLEVEKNIFQISQYDDGINFFARHSLSSLKKLITPIPAQFLENLFSRDLKSYVLKSTLDPKLDTWLTVSAIEVSIQAFPDDFNSVIEYHLKPRKDESEKDHIFIRRRLIKYMSRYIYRFPHWVEYFKIFSEDHKPYVRQGVAKYINTIVDDTEFFNLFKMLYSDEKEPSVRAQLSLSILDGKKNIPRMLKTINTLESFMCYEKDEYVSRVNLHVAEVSIGYLINSTGYTPSKNIKMDT